MDTAVFALTDAEYKDFIGENTMDTLIVDVSTALILDS